MEYKAIVQHDFIADLSAESFTQVLDKENTEEVKAIPVYGDYSSAIGARLNELYAKDKEHQGEMIESLGRDLGDEDPTYDYQLGRKDVVTNIDNHQVTVKDTHLAIEHVNHGVDGIGLYDVSHQLAGVCKGVENSIVLTVSQHGVTDALVEKIRQLIIDGKHVCLVIVLPEDVRLEEIDFESGALYELMSQTNHLSVFATYIIK